MSLKSLGLATLGLLKRGAKASLHIATLGLLRTNDGAVIEKQVQGDGFVKPGRKKVLNFSVQNNNAAIILIESTIF